MCPDKCSYDPTREKYDLTQPKKFTFRFQISMLERTEHMSARRILRRCAAGSTQGRMHIYFQIKGFENTPRT